MTDFHIYEPRLGHGLRHDPLNMIIAPRPIGWISSLSASGQRNLAPYSFFNAFNYKPPIVGFSSIGWKDSIANIAATKEFGWSLATRALAEPMNASCAEVPPEVDEFELAGLTPAASKLIKAPRVAESPVSFECRLTQLIQLKNAEGGEINSWVAFGEVVAVHIDTRLIKDGVYDTVAAEPIARGGGPADYFTVTEANRFRMLRPEARKAG